MEVKRLSALDSLRGLAAMGIAFFWHYCNFNPQVYPFNEKAYWFYHYGYSLVDLFFVLSGFIFSYVYKERIINNKIEFNKYAKLRFARLYPLMFVTLIVVAILQTLRMATLNNFFQGRFDCIDVYHFLLNIFCIQGIGFEETYSFNGPSWSISCEIIAYIIFYYIMSKHNKNKNYYIGYLVMIFVGLFIIKTQINYPLLNQKTARVFVGFFMGNIVYEINNYIKNNKYKNNILIGMILILAIVVISASLYSHIVLGNWIIVYATLVYPLIILLILNVDFINKILSIKPLVYVGELSFSIYLWNFPLQNLIAFFNDYFGLNINYSSKVFFVFFVLISLIVAAFSYELIEKKSNAYLRKKI